MESTLNTQASNPSRSDTDSETAERDAIAGRAAQSMRTPAFFEEAPRITVRDALAETLGAADGGVIDYSYVDAVKLAGHSCPTVAGAWLMTRAALIRLYPNELPRRGELQVEMREAQESGVAGVIAGVAGLVTGAAGAGGFKGLGGRHVRRGLLEFARPMRGHMRITRVDTGHGVEVAHHPEVVARPALLGLLMQAALSPGADAAARLAFATAWQGWVRTMLVDHANDPALITLED